MTTALVWFRRDFRLADNPALTAALARCDQAIPVYIHAPAEESPWQPGAATRWWTHHSLDGLRDSLAGKGSRLIVRRGNSQAVLEELIAETNATHLYWNRLYDPATLTRDKAIKAWATEQGLEVESHNAYLLNEPWKIHTGKGTPYRVFTPYWKNCHARPVANHSLPAPTALPAVPAGYFSHGIDELTLLPRIRWDHGIGARWRPGEASASQALDDFLDDTASGYRDGRNLPAVAGTSSLSPHLHFGEISPQQILERCRQRERSPGIEDFVREIYWREFAYHLLYHFSDTPERALDVRFREFPWLEDSAQNLTRWQEGTTGIPIVDAGMRELWHTGWMHNRVRMIVASLLTKNLLIPWQAGAAWFWDTLVDADLANNTLGWQWTAGCGADAAPYFRIFNPVSQGEKFDSRGTYVRRWLPELNGLPDKWVHKPWEAPATVLAAANVRLGTDYPEPIVDLKQSRARALTVWDEIKTRA